MQAAILVRGGPLVRDFLAYVAVAILLLCRAAYAQGPEQTLVDRSTLAVEDMMTQGVSQDPRIMLGRARAVMICPRVFKAGFIIGGAGGSCVLLARGGNGTWSYPVFYGMGSGSVGFQIGIQDSELILLIMTKKGLNAIMDSQFKFGADASIAVATVGASIGGSTTAAVGADILAFAMNRGLFGGVALDGTIMSLRSDWNRAYYGQPYSAREIVMQMVAANPGADPLRGVLSRYGSGATIPAAAPPPPPPPPPMSGPGPMEQGPPVQQGPGYAQPYPPGNQTGAGQPVQQEPLPAPGR
jgi:SH3 domain-containing YSC84-like protein 1